MDLMFNLMPGLLQGITRVGISYPADVVKVQMQKNLHSTTIGTVQHVLKTDIGKFYRGSSIAFVTIGIERSLQYYYLENMNKKMVNPEVLNQYISKDFDSEKIIDLVKKHNL